MRKKIGIFAQERRINDRVFNNLAREYIRTIEGAHAISIPIPLQSEHLTEYLEFCDGFIFPGGTDIDPKLYNAHIDGAHDIHIDHDQWLFRAMGEVIATEKPILGICKGMQLLNVVYGGSLKQNVENRHHHEQHERGYSPVDTADIIPGTWLTQIWDAPIPINSLHHQAVQKLGIGLVVSARSQYDGEIEAIGHTDLPHYGIQWHPEMLENHQLLMTWFVRGC